MTTPTTPIGILVDARATVQKFITDTVYKEETLPKFYVEVIVSLPPNEGESVWRVYCETDLPDDNLYIVKFDSQDNLTEVAVFYKGEYFAKG